MTTLTTKGQVTIPKAVRDLLGLRPGAEVEFEVASDGRVYLQPRAPGVQSRFSRLRGSAKGGMSTDQIMMLTRAGRQKK